MPKLKKKLTGNFTIINNTVLRDKRMGCTERGAYDPEHRRFRLHAL